jgi:CheY-like chemotaxis protein
LFNGDDAVIFTHIVLVLRDVDEIISFMDQILKSSSYSGTSIVVITDLVQRRDIMAKAPGYDYEALRNERRLRFIFKPSKPSKFSIIFDPQKERELSSDRNQDSAQAVAVSQKQVFDEMKKRLGDKGIRVLLVEDNKTNQMVLLKFLNRVSITVESALDGVQCTDKVFSNPYGYYSIILVSISSSYLYIVILAKLGSSSAISTCPTKTATKPARTSENGNATTNIHTCPSLRSRPTSSAMCTPSV